ncbi:L-lactate dehydrogenase [Klebsiella pneumoniae]|nr:L-lactate dehydrogenase [Klebsiella pneumoniae]
MHTKARKVMIIGAGNVGASAAYALLNQSICEELILVDLNQQRAEAHAQDLSDAAAYLPGMMNHLHPRGQRLRRCRYRGDHRLRRRAAPRPEPAG